MAILPKYAAKVQPDARTPYIKGFFNKKRREFTTNSREHY
jgi:hypothetical protein